MKGGELDNSFGGAGDWDGHRSGTSSMHCGSSALDAPCSPSSPSTSSGYVSIARSTSAPLSQGKKYIDIQLLTREHLYLAVDVKCKVGDVYRCVCTHIGLNCVTLFGLAHYAENEYRFCDLDERLSKYSKSKTWQKAPGWGTDVAGSPSVILYLRVHTYIDYVRLINCPVSLLHYYLQLRENVRIQWEPSWVAEERCFESAALALQADFGDYQADKHTTGYFRSESYFPGWVVNARGLDFVLRHLPVMHQDLESLDPMESRIRYCREVSSPPCPVNLHLYRLRRQKTDSQETVYLGISPAGLELFEQKSNGQRQHLNSFSWAKVGKLAFDRKKFTLVSLDGQKIVLYTSSDEKSRYLLNFCRAVHQNLIRLQSALHEARKREVDEKKLFRESYIYSDIADLDLARKMDSRSLPNGSPSSAMSPCNGFPNCTIAASTCNGSVVICCGGGGQRVSLVSDASSNTTSGIVSDRQQTHEDSENENEGDADFEVTTGCDSSPLVSELSLATTGTSVHVGICGGRSSQQASPVCESDIAEEQDKSGKEHEEAEYSHDGSAAAEARRRSRLISSDAETEDVDPGEGSSSVGPCSDRTVTAVADDAQSTGTTSTTGKLEDLSAEGELYGAQSTISYASPGMDRIREQPSSNRRGHNASPSLSINGDVSIAELRRLTLHDYQHQRPAQKRRPSPPILSPPMPSQLIDNSSSGQFQTDGKAFVGATAYASGQFLDNVPNGHVVTADGPHESASVGHHQTPLWDLRQTKSYRIISTQASMESNQNGDAGAMGRNKSTPSPPRLDSLLFEPPPPPPYPYESEPTQENKIVQSYSLSHLPTSSLAVGANGNSWMTECHRQQQRRLQRTSVDGLPNYEQALQYKMEMDQRVGASALELPSSVSWLPPTAARRWPTVGGIHPAVMDQLVPTTGTRRLQQAQSEPGLAGPYCGHTAHDCLPNRRYCCGAGIATESYPSQFAYFPYVAKANGDVDVTGPSAYRSVSTYQLASSGVCACQQPYGQPPPVFHHHPHPNLHSLHAHYANGTHAGPTCTPNGLYVKQSRGPVRPVGAPAGHRLHPLEYHQHALYNGEKPGHGNAGSKAVARVHSMYEAAKADQVRRNLEYEYYRRIEQQVVRSTRRELRKQQMEMERQLSATFGESNSQRNSCAELQPTASGNVEHGKLGHFCESCQEIHTAGKIDIAQLKDIIRSQEVDLPLIRALCNDKSWEQRRTEGGSAVSSATNDSATHPLLRQKKPKTSRQEDRAALEMPCQVYNGRPLTWHESSHETQQVSLSNWPARDVSYNR